MYHTETTTSLPMVIQEELKTGEFTISLAENDKVVLHLYCGYNIMELDKQVLLKILDQLEDSIQENYFRLGLVPENKKPQADEAR